MSRRFKKRLDWLGREYLTPKQYECAYLATLGLHDTEIACKLGTTRRTVATHLVTVYDKLNITDRLKLVYIFKNYPPLCDTFWEDLETKIIFMYAFKKKTISAIASALMCSDQKVLTTIKKISKNSPETQE